MKRLWLWTLTSCVVMSPAAHAFDWFGGRLSLGGGYGYAKPKLPYSFQDNYKEAPMWTANMKYFVNNDVSLVASYADLHGKNRTSPNDVHLRPLIGSVRYNIFHHLPISPYLTAGAGVGFNRKENPDGTDTTWTKLALQGGLGFEFFINEHNSVGVEALYHNFVGENDTVPYRLASVVGMVNIYFGEGPHTKRIREQSETDRQRAEAAERDAAAARQQAAAAQQQAVASQTAAQQAAQQAAAQAEAQRAEAERKAQELQAQIQQAQNEMDAIKGMVARKDISPVTFETGRATLLASSSATLDHVAGIAKKYPSLKLRVEGHTDSQGSEDYNQKLSQQRADAVREYLTTKGGVNPDQVVAVGFGETRPAATNDTAAGRSQNRRVEFIFFLK